MAHNRYPNRRWMFLTSGDAATGVNFNQVMETSPATCRYNVAPTPGTETFVKYNVIEYPQHSGNEPQIPVYSGWRQDSPADQPTWEGEEQYPETAVQGGTDDTYKYDYEVTGSGAYLEYSKPTVTGGGWIENLSIMNGGFGYSADGTLTATGGGGNGFAGTFTSTVGSPVQNLDIVNPGGGYSPEGTLTATGGGGSGFAGTFSQTSGVINSAVIMDQGENYVSAPEIAIVSTGEVDGTGGVVSSSVQLSGALSSVDLENAGWGYSSEPTIIIGTNGTGGAVTPTTNSWSASGYEFDHEETINILRGPNWTPTGIM